jgi:elongation factor P
VTDGVEDVLGRAVEKLCSNRDPARLLERDFALAACHTPVDQPSPHRHRGVLCPSAVAEIVNTNQFRNGMHIEHRGSVWRIVEFQHVKPGKGGAFVRTKLKNLESGAVVEDTFRAGEKFPRVHTEVKNVQFLYDDGSEAHFMDEETYEQFGLPRAEIAGELAYMLPSSTVQILQVNGKPSGIQMPASVELAVAETEPGVRGDTVSNVTKPATLETGAVVQVPLFVDVGERIKVDPREARYISRA